MARVIGFPLAAARGGDQENKRRADRRSSSSALFRYSQVSVCSRLSPARHDRSSWMAASLSSSVGSHAEDADRLLRERAALSRGRWSFTSTSLVLRFSPSQS